MPSSRCAKKPPGPRRGQATARWRGQRTGPAVRAADHRILPCTANLALEAWAPGKGECIAEWRQRFRRSRVRNQDNGWLGSVALLVPRR
jgi:hypothetical protein